MEAHRAQMIAHALQGQGVAVLLRDESRHQVGSMMKQTTWTYLYFDEEWVLALVVLAQKYEDPTAPASAILKQAFKLFELEAIEALWRLNGVDGLQKLVARARKRTR